MRAIAFLEYGAILGGLVAMAAGHFFVAPKAFHLGVFLVGAGLALGGLESLFTRRMSFRFAGDAAERYEGAPALIWGSMALLAGSAVIAAAYLLSEGLGRAALDYLVRRPAPALAAAGVLIAGSGALLFFNPHGRRGVARWLLVRLPRVLLGLVLVLAGIAAVGVAAWDWFEPRTIDRLLRALPGLRR